MARGRGGQEGGRASRPRSSWTTPRCPTAGTCASSAPSKSKSPSPSPEPGARLRTPSRSSSRRRSPRASSRSPSRNPSRRPWSPSPSFRPPRPGRRSRASAARGSGTSWGLATIAREHSGGDAIADEERTFLLMYLRDFARVHDGLLPVDFVDLRPAELRRARSRPVDTRRRRFGASRPSPGSRCWRSPSCSSSRTATVAAATCRRGRGRGTRRSRRGMRRRARGVRGGRLVAATTAGVGHPVLPCGVRIYIRYGDRTVLTTVIDHGDVPPGRELNLTPRLASLLGVHGTRSVQWRFTR